MKLEDLKAKLEKYPKLSEEITSMVKINKKASANNTRSITNTMHATLPPLDRDKLKKIKK